jgi:hypothetical protein
LDKAFRCSSTSSSIAANSIRRKKAARRAGGLDSKPAWNTSEKAIRWWSRASIGWRGQTLHLCQIATNLERKQVNLQVLDQNINTKGIYT